MKNLNINTTQIKFMVVGCINTAIDFGVLFLLTFFGLDKIIANYFSTGAGLIFSFFANKSFTFQDKNAATKKQVVLFIGVTLVGLWILQPLVIWGMTAVLSSTTLNNFFSLLLAKIAATIVSLLWNYIFYSRLVFKKTIQPSS